MTVHDSAPTTPTSTSGPTRRGFFAAAGLGAAAVALAACSSDKKTTDTGASSTSTTTTAPAGSTSDLDTAAAAAGLEVLAVQTYDAALLAANAGLLGPVPPAVAEFASTARSHHQAALDRWNNVLSVGGRPEVTEANAKLKPTVDAQFAAATDVNGVAALALMLEETAAATYQKAIPTLVSKDAMELAGSIQVIDAQHVAVLLFVSGQYPVPDVFALTDKAAI